MKLHRLPSSYIFAILGTFGAGKTLYLLESGIDFACYYRKKIACNFWVNEVELRKFARKYNKPWLSICRIKHSLSIHELLQEHNSILLMDEAGLELFSRNWKNRTRLELDALLRIRHYKNKLLYVAQRFDDIDIKFRNHTQLICWVRGFQLPKDPPELVCRFVIFFKKDKFNVFMEKDSNQTKLIYPLKLSGFRYRFDFVKSRQYYQDLFKLYDSFDADHSRFVDKIEFSEDTLQFIDGNQIDWNSNLPVIINDSRYKNKIVKLHSDLDKAI